MHEIIIEAEFEVFFTKPTADTCLSGQNLRIFYENPKPL